MTEPIILESRFSMIWVNGFLPRGRLSRRSDYDSVFEQARSRKGERVRGESGWLLPWPDHPRQGFWKHYLEVDKLATVEPRRAWNHLMPFTRPPMLTARPESRGEST